MLSESVRDCIESEIGCKQSCGVEYDFDDNTPNIGFRVVFVKVEFV